MKYIRMYTEKDLMEEKQNYLQIKSMKKINHRDFYSELLDGIIHFMMRKRKLVRFTSTIFLQFKFDHKIKLM